MQRLQCNARSFLKQLMQLRDRTYRRLGEPRDGEGNQNFLRSAVLGGFAPGPVTFRRIANITSKNCELSVIAGNQPKKARDRTVLNS